MSSEENNWKCLGLDSHPFIKQNGAPLSRVSSVDLVQDDLRTFLAEQEPKIAVVTGPRGVGKTRVSLDFINNIDNRHIRYVSANRGLGVTSTLKLIADVAGLEPLADGLSPEIAIHRMVESIKQVGAKFVMIVDNASELPIQALSLITMILAKLPSTLYCKFIIIGQPIMFDRVSKLAQADQYHFEIKHIHMKPFTYLETQQYIYDNLYACGWQGQPNRINEEVIKSIYHLSHGVARQINSIASDELLRELSEERVQSTQVDSVKGLKKSLIVATGVLTLGSTLYATNVWTHKQDHSQAFKPKTLPVVQQNVEKELGQGRNFVKVIPNAAQDKVKVDAAPSLTKSAQKPQNDQSQAQDSSSIQEALADGGHDASDPLLLTTETVHNTDVETSMAELFQKTTNDQLQTQSSPSTQETVAVDTVNAFDDALVLTNETVQNAVDGFYLESQSLFRQMNQQMS